MTAGVARLGVLSRDELRRSSISRKSLGSSCIFPSKVLPRSSEDPQGGCPCSQQLLGQGPPPLAERPEDCASRDGLDLGGASSQWELSCPSPQLYQLFLSVGNQHEQPRLLSGNAPIPVSPQDNMPGTPSLRYLPGLSPSYLPALSPSRRHLAQSDAFCTFGALGYPSPSPLILPHAIVHRIHPTSSLSSGWKLINLGSPLA